MPLNLDKRSEDQPEEKSSGSTFVSTVMLMLFVIFIVTYGVGKSYLELQSKVVLAEESSLEQQADDARAMFAKGNYVTILAHENLSIRRRNESAEYNSNDCSAGAALCLLNGIAFPLDQRSSYQRHVSVAKIPDEYLMAPFEQGLAVSCATRRKKATRDATFLVGSADIGGNVAEELRQHVALIHRQTGAVPLVYGANTDRVRRFYAQTGSELKSADGLIYRFPLKHGYSWVTAVSRGGKGELITVFEPYQHRNGYRVESDGGLCY